MAKLGTQTATEDTFMGADRECEQQPVPIPPSFEKYRHFEAFSVFDQRRDE
jgi:hypothetical protein